MHTARCLLRCFSFIATRKTNRHEPMIWKRIPLVVPILGRRNVGVVDDDETDTMWIVPWIRAQHQVKLLTALIMRCLEPKTAEIILASTIHEEVVGTANAARNPILARIRNELPCKCSLPASWKTSKNDHKLVTLLVVPHVVVHEIVDAVEVVDLLHNGSDNDQLFTAQLFK